VRLSGSPDSQPSNYRSKGKTQMTKLALAISGAILTLSVSGMAHAEEKETKAKRPAVCVDFRVVVAPAEGGHAEQKMGICYDGKKPSIFKSWQKVSLTNENGAPATYVVGWR
jgi:hypothetical protein